MELFGAGPRARDVDKRDIAIRGGFGPPSDGLCHILGNAIAGQISHAKLELGCGVTFVGQIEQWIDRLCRRCGGSGLLWECAEWKDKKRHAPESRLHPLSRKQFRLYLRRHFH